MAGGRVDLDRARESGVDAVDRDPAPPGSSSEAARRGAEGLAERFFGEAGARWLSHLGRKASFGRLFGSAQSPDAKQRATLAPAGSTEANGISVKGGNVPGGRALLRGVDASTPSPTHEKAPAEAGAAAQNPWTLTPQQIVADALPEPVKGQPYDIPALRGPDANKAIYALGMAPGIERLKQAGVLKPVEAEPGDWQFDGKEPWWRGSGKAFELVNSENWSGNPNRQLAIFAREGGRIALGTVPMPSDNPFGNPHGLPDPQYEVTGPLAGQIRQWMASFKH